MIYPKDVINKIICGDCLKVMKNIPDNTIDLIITSPPFNVGMPYGNNDRKNYESYLDIMEKVLFECYRILKKAGKIAINLPSSILQSSSSRMAYLSLDFVLIMRRIGFLDREWIGWIKIPRGEIPAKSTSWGSWKMPTCPYCRDAMEYIIIMDKETHKREDKKEQNDITTKEFLKYTSNCWYFTPETKRIHPAPFPEELPYRIIKLYSYIGDIVLDPFVGSGTTCLVAKKTKRKFIGIELEEKWVELAKDKVNQEILF